VVDVVSDVLTGSGGGTRGMEQRADAARGQRGRRACLYIAKTAIDEGIPDRGVSVTFGPARRRALLASGSPMLAGAIVHFIESLLEALPGRRIHVRTTRGRA
jgi:hypothetical protein